MAASQGEHARLPAGTVVNNRYVVGKEIGCGNFSKVYECKDTKCPKYTAANPSASPTLALKVLKREYANDASFERDMLKVLAVKDPTNSANVSKMHDQFTWNRYPCFVMPLRGPSLRSRKLGVSRGNLTRADLLRFAKSLVQSLKFVHFDCRMVHTDLKPENILLTNVDAAPTDVGADWMICDFGSASLWRTEKMDSDLISTRPYRAPEVVLGNPWSYPADMWSLGCILYEAACGSRLFEVHDDNTHLHYMSSRLGGMPESFTRNSKHSRKFFDATGSMLRPLVSSGSAASRTAGSSASLPRPLTEVFKDDPLLLDLLKSMLNYDPTKRIRADDALGHPVFSDAHPATDAPLSTPQRTSSAESVAVDAANANAKPAVVNSGRHASGAPPAGSAASLLERRTPPSGEKSSALGAYKFRALPPLINALNAIHINDNNVGAKENLVTPKTGSAAHAAAVVASHRPVKQSSCRTPEELKRAPLSAHSGLARAAAKSGAAAQQPTSKNSYSHLPTKPQVAASAAAGGYAAASIAPAGRSSGLQYGR